jgi:hypothetical protein
MSIRTLPRRVRDAEADVKRLEGEFATSSVGDGMAMWAALKDARTSLAALQRELDERDLTGIITGKRGIGDGVSVDIYKAARLYGAAVATLERHLARSAGSLCLMGQEVAQRALHVARDRLEIVQRRMARGQAEWHPIVAGGPRP